MSHSKNVQNREVLQCCLSELSVLFPHSKTRATVDDLKVLLIKFIDRKSEILIFNYLILASDVSKF